MPTTRFDLESFMRKLTLEPMTRTARAPPMPKAQSTVTPLTMKPGGYRKLKQIKRITFLEPEVTRYFQKLGARMSDGSAFTGLKLPSQIPTHEMEQRLRFNPYEADNIPAVLFAIERGPLGTAEKLVHAADEETKDLHFFTPRRNGTLNNQGVEPMYFCKLDDKHNMESVKCVVVALAPWEFAPQDFRDFTEKGTFVDGNKSINGKLNPKPWQNADKMWAYVHDLCVMHDCRHFVVTCYQEWAFGGFSTYFSRGYVSDRIMWNNTPNSAIQILTYWLLASCHSLNTIILERVPGEQHIDGDIFAKERELYGKRMLNDGLLGLGPDLESEDTRPAKRARLDPLEENVGWEPLTDYHITRFPSAQEAWPKADEGHYEPDDDWQRDDFAKPSLLWNRWQHNELRRRASQPVEIAQEKYEKDAAAELRRPLFGPPVPSDSLDVDRENEDFRPDLVDTAPVPRPSP